MISLASEARASTRTHKNKMAVKKALVLSCLLGASFLAQAAPASFVVQDIQVEGLQRVTLGAAL